MQHDVNGLQVFTYGERPVRMIEREDGPWWVLADVCEALEIKQSRNVASRLDDDEKGVQIMDTPGGQQTVTIVNEPGLYSVILRSNKPEARAFKRWITHEVLPTIRRTGGYGSAAERMERFAEQAAAAIEAMNERLTALEARETGRGRPRVLAQAWSAEALTAPGIVSRRRWMRTANEKLDELEVKFDATRNQLLHLVYKALEDKFDVSLDEARLVTMERYGLPDCTTLEAVFRSDEYRDWFERVIDANLDPELRGW